MAKKKHNRIKKPRAEKTIWSQEEEAILRKYREGWLDLENREERDEYCIRVGEEIRELTPEKYGVIVVMRNRHLKEGWERRLKAIKTWFNNHRGPAKERQVFKFERKVQLRNVIAHYKHDEIEDEVVRLCPGEKPGSRIYFKHYQRALANIKKEISEEEMEFYLEKQKEWQNMAPPAEVQRKTARKYGKRAIMNMHEVAYKQMGMTAITIEAHENENGELGLTFHDYNKDLAGANIHFQSFLEFNRKACSEFSKAFGQWAVKVMEARNGSAQMSGDRSPIVILSKGPNGMPILPPPILSQSGLEHLKTQRELIREFIRLHYRLASNKDNVSPPWESMGMFPEEFFFPGQIPQGFIFKDPTRMKGEEVKKLLKHFRDYQAQTPNRGFSFQRVMMDGKFVMASYQATVNANEDSSGTGVPDTMLNERPNLSINSDDHSGSEDSDEPDSDEPSPDEASDNGNNQLEHQPLETSQLPRNSTSGYGQYGRTSINPQFIDVNELSATDPMQHQLGHQRQNLIGPNTFGYTPSQHQLTQNLFSGSTHHMGFNAFYQDEGLRLNQEPSVVVHNPNGVFVGVSNNGSQLDHTQITSQPIVMQQHQVGDAGSSGLAPYQNHFSQYPQSHVQGSMLHSSLAHYTQSQDPIHGIPNGNSSNQQMCNNGRPSYILPPPLPFTFSPAQWPNNEGQIEADKGDDQKQMKHSQKPKDLHSKATPSASKRSSQKRKSELSAPDSQPSKKTKTVGKKPKAVKAVNKKASKS